MVRNRQIDYRRIVDMASLTAFVERLEAVLWPRDKQPRLKWGIHFTASTTEFIHGSLTSNSTLPKPLAFEVLAEFL